MLWGEMYNIKYFIIKVPNIKAILYLPLSLAPQKKSIPAIRKSIKRNENSEPTFMGITPQCSTPQDVFIVFPV